MLNEIMKIKKAWVLLLIFLLSGIFLSKIFVSAQQDTTFEEKILKKLEAIKEAQSNNQEALNKILNSLEDIKKELEVIKIRATVH
ncbi:MAG: hypothetical protein Q8O13_09980 [Candidatus Omnitrophota bacterium]|nr:hypothetical protein [Candidatus Omnitrophota bacterium]